jgi:hypothetical protein
MHVQIYVHKLCKEYQPLGGAPTPVPAREGAPRGLSALRATTRHLLEPSRWLLFHSLHNFLHLDNFRCFLQFLCIRLSRIHANHGSNNNHPNTSPTQTRGCHRRIRPTTIIYKYNRKHIASIAWRFFFDAAFACPFLPALQAGFLFTLAWTGHAGLCEATRALIYHT